MLKLIDEVFLMEKKPKKKKVKRHLNPIVYKIMAFIPFMLVAIVFIVIILLVVNSKLRRWVKNIFMLLTLVVMIVESLFCIYGTSALNF